MRMDAVFASVCGLVTALLGITAHVDDGRVLFHKTWTVQEGLGPAFNAASCAACHVDSRSSSLTSNRTTVGTPIVWVASTITDATGGHLFQRFRVRDDGSLRALPPPAGSARRRAPSLLGLGLLERAIANGVVGRFGWKARYANLDEVLAAALAGEMGLTSPRFPHRFEGAPDKFEPEVSSTQVLALVEFVRGLPAPKAAVQAVATHQGSELLRNIGCTRCHQPELAVAPSTGGVAIAAQAYTDLMIHDLGPALADGVSEGNAGPTQFRTAPLWGLRDFPQAYLHDGRASTLDQAIRLHDGEASNVTRRYIELTAEYRRVLIMFLESL